MASRDQVRSGVSRKSMAPPIPDAMEPAGVDCTPGVCAGTCGACLMFIMSLLTVASLGVIAGGAFWMAQVSYRITNGNNHVNTLNCFSDVSFENTDTYTASRNEDGTLTHGQDVDTLYGNLFGEGDLLQELYKCHCSHWSAGTADPKDCKYNHPASSSR